MCSVEAAVFFLNNRQSSVTYAGGDVAICNCYSGSALFRIINLEFLHYAPFRYNERLRLKNKVCSFQIHVRKKKSVLDIKSTRVFEESHDYPIVWFCERTRKYKLNCQSYIQSHIA